MSETAFLEKADASQGDSEPAPVSGSVVHYQRENFATSDLKHLGANDRCDRNLAATFRLE